MEISFFLTGKMDLSKMDSEIYEIDYRGPETHTYIPPPKGSRGKHNFHHQSMLKHHRKFKGLKASKLGEISVRNFIYSFIHHELFHFFVNSHIEADPRF